MITTLVILSALLFVGCIVLFLLWQKEIGMDHGHICDEECYEWGCEESGDLYMPSEGAITLQGDTLRAAMEESLLGLREQYLMDFKPFTGAKIVNLTPSGMRIPFESTTLSD